VVAVFRAIPNPSQAARALQAATNRAKKFQNRGLNPAGLFREAVGGKTVSLHSYKGGELERLETANSSSQKRRQLLIRVHNETLAVVAVWLPRAHPDAEPNTKLSVLLDESHCQNGILFLKGRNNEQGEASFVPSRLG
jgi:hypothetical protein